MKFRWLMLRLLAALVTCGCGSSGSGTNSPPAEWTQWKTADGGNGHYYRVVRTKGSWDDARTAAEATGAYLVTITSAAEEAFIVSKYLTFADQLAVFWMGCSDRQTEDTWQWVTGEPFSYTDWKSGEPNGWDGADEDYCCINWNAVRGPIGEWNDTLPAGSKGYDSGANDGPYMSIIESDKTPK